MKKLLLILLLFCLVLTVWAAMTATENFDSYSTGADLNGGVGGTNWYNDDDWTGTAATWSVQTAPSGMTGKAARNTVTNDDMHRQFIATTAGTVCMKMMLSITNPNDFIGFVLIYSADSPEIYVRLGPTGNVEAYDNAIANYVSIGSYSANTALTVCAQWDQAAQPNKFRVNINGGTYSSWLTVEDGTLVTLDTLRLDASATGTRTFWVDDIDDQVIGGGASAVPVISQQLSRRRRNQ